MNGWIDGSLSDNQPIEKTALCTLRTQLKRL